jgi:hypothetical protein
MRVLNTPSEGTIIRALYIVYHRGARGTSAEDSASVKGGRRYSCNEICKGPKNIRG